MSIERKSFTARHVKRFNSWGEFVQWDDEVSAVGWLLERLKEQGIELTEGAQP